MGEAKSWGEKGPMEVSLLRVMAQSEGTKPIHVSSTGARIWLTNVSCVKWGELLYPHDHERLKED